MKLRTTLIAAGTTALVLAPAAAAHVTVHPDAVSADSFQRFSIQVPVERDVPTTKLKVQLPEGLVFVSFEPKPGWKRTVTMAKLATPVTMEGETITERVASVEWSGGEIMPGEFDEFIMSAHVPNEPGKELVFPANQTYSNGEVVRWIGAPDADEPAPRVTLEAASGGNETAATPVAATSDDNSDSNDNLAIGLAIAGIVLSLIAIASVFFWRRPRPA
jgi:uncharacterized protein